MIRTRFTELVGCAVPIQMAGMGSLGRPKLAAAVANAGALGMLGWAGAPPDHIVQMFDEVRRLTPGPVGINFIADGWVDPVTRELDAEAVIAVEAASTRAKVLEFFYSEPHVTPVEIAHRGGALAAWQVGTKEEAISAEQAGCDFIVAQGVEAGGHVRGKTGLKPLLREVCAAVEKPVVAAGGIGTGRAMAEALNAGASAVRVGTRLVAAAESEAHPVYLERLIGASADDTILTEAFSTNWPNAPHRVLRGCVEALAAETREVIGYRIRPWAPDHPVPIQRGDSIAAMTTTTGNVDAMPHWAGVSVGDVRRVDPAREIIGELVREAEPLVLRL